MASALAPSPRASPDKWFFLRDLMRNTTGPAGLGEGELGPHLANWLGIPCKAQFVQHAHKRGAAGGPFTIDNDPKTNPWTCRGNLTTSRAEIP
eukprot:6572897-Pyramimonas_sp.AAC.1